MGYVGQLARAQLVDNLQGQNSIYWGIGFVLAQFMSCVCKRVLVGGLRYTQFIFVSAGVKMFSQIPGTSLFAYPKVT